MNNKPLFDSSEWSFDLLEKTWQEIDRIGKDVFNLDYYNPSLEVITSGQMLEAYSSVAMPIMYDHWSYGKSFVKNEMEYRKGKQGLAYEVVINTNPCIAYLMENNSMTMQTLVMAHAVCGHGSFFKNNYLFKEWTDADSILDYLRFSRDYIKKCEYKYGEKRVEIILDACHAIRYYGVDKYKRNSNVKKLDKASYNDKNFDPVWNTLGLNREYKEKRTGYYYKDGRSYPEENLLYFIEKNSSVLKDWEKEILRIVRKISQYFYPQMQTQLMNEGWATFIHHEILTHMHDMGLITDGSYLEFLDSHAGVIFQPSPSSSINVYALGFAMMKDLKRVCEDPDEEDKKWFPEIADTDWKVTLPDIVANYRDESFVLQFLSPKIIRKFKLFAISDDANFDDYEVLGVQSDEDVYIIRDILSRRYNLSYSLPHIQVTGVDEENTRTLFIQHVIRTEQILQFDNLLDVRKYISYLWGYPVDIEEVLDGH